jgi:anti-sigma B factor antagonist
MQIHAGPTFERSELFSILGPCLHAVERQVEGVAVIDLTGPLVREVPIQILRQKVQAVVERGSKKLAINLAEVPYLDSCGVAALVSAYNLTRGAGAQIKFFAAPERLVHLLARLRLDTVLELYESEPSAVSSFRDSG